MGPPLLCFKVWYLLLFSFSITEGFYLQSYVPILPWLSQFLLSETICVLLHCLIVIGKLSACLPMAHMFQTLWISLLSWNIWSLPSKMWESQVNWDLSSGTLHTCLQCAGCSLRTLVARESHAMEVAHVPGLSWWKIFTSSKKAIIGLASG